MEKLLQLDPAEILVVKEDNPRHYPLNKAHIASLADSITELGGVQEPVSVVPNEGAKKGEPKYKLLYGFYRHAAVSQLNKDGAGLKLPALVRDTPADAGAALVRQLTENVKRQNLSPMDTAVAIRRLLDAGKSKVEIRAMFPMPAAKGTQPMSNALLNIYLSMLNLPKSVQGLINEGTIGVSAAYELGKVDPARVEEVVESAKASRQAEIDRAAKEEDRFLKTEDKANKAVQRAEERKAAIVTSRAEVTDLAAKVAEANGRLKAAKAIEYDVNDAKAKAAYTESVRAAENDVKSAGKLKKDADNKLAKLLGEEQKEEEKAAAPVADAAPAKAAKEKPLSQKDVQKAAKEVGTGKNVALSVSEIRSGLKDMRKEGVPAKVVAIAAVFEKLITGELTPKLAIEDLAVLTGEWKPRKRAAEK